MSILRTWFSVAPPLNRPDTGRTELLQLVLRRGWPKGVYFERACAVSRLVVISTTFFSGHSRESMQHASIQADGLHDQATDNQFLNNHTICTSPTVSTSLASLRPTSAPRSLDCPRSSGARWLRRGLTMTASLRGTNVSPTNNTTAVEDHARIYFGGRKPRVQGR